MTGVLAQAKRDEEAASRGVAFLDRYAKAYSFATMKRPEGTDTDEAAELNRLAHLSPIEYERERKDAAERLGLRASTLDAEVSKLRPKEEKTEEHGHEVKFDEPEPWPEPVEVAEVLGEIAETIKRFVVMPDESVHAAALWIVHAWAFNAARVSPILAVTSPEKRCGKTTLLEVLASLTPRSLSASNITAAPLFRAVEKYEPTLLIDEADTFLRNSDELRGVLNSGHRRRSANIIRCVGDDNEPRQFRTWAPKAIALIGSLPGTLADRSINVALRRRGPGEMVERWRDESFPELRRKLARFAADNGTTLKEARPELAAGLHDRACDNWEPLFAIADVAGGNWPAQTRQAAARLSGDEDESAPTMLLADILDLFEEIDKQGARLERITSTNLCEHLATMEARPWPEWGRTQKPITPRQVARLLKPFGIRPKQARHGEHNFKGYERPAFDDAFSRYLPDLSATTLQRARTAAFGQSLSATERQNVADEKPRKPAPQAACSGVADRNPETAEEGENDAAEAYRRAKDGARGFDL